MGMHMWVHNGEIYIGCKDIGVSIRINFVCFALMCIFLMYNIFHLPFVFPHGFLTPNENVK